MDENMPPAVADQLRATDIDVSSVHELEIFSEDDPILLELANEVERVICTHDADFLRLAQAGMEHAGTVFFDRGQRNIGYHGKKFAKHSARHHDGRDEKPGGVSLRSALATEVIRG